MKVLGYNGGLDGYPSHFDSSHDSAAAIVVDGEVVAACEEERFSREKHSGKFPRLAMEFCLKQAGLKSAAELDLVTYYEVYPLWFDAQMITHNFDHFGVLGKVALTTAVHAMRQFNKVAGYDNDRPRKIFEKAMGVKLRPGQFAPVKHHTAHVASAFYDSPLDRALCLTIDAQGEASSAMGAVAKGTDLDVIYETFAPNSLGYMYAFITKYLGFAHHDEYKIMGLAPYGRPGDYLPFFQSIIEKKADGTTIVDPALLSYLAFRDAALPPGKGYPNKLLKMLGPARVSTEPVLQRHMDIAAALQVALEDAVLHTLTALQKRTGEKNLVMAGGVALNSTMNGKIARSGLFENVWIQPAAHDSGTALGAALYGYHNVLNQPRTKVTTKVPRYLGPGYTDADVEAAVKQFDSDIKVHRPDDVVAFAAQQIADGKVVGWYQGAMEWGPRALGNRSIVADPRRDEMKDVVNHAVKMREGFRPFAPSCLAEKANEWFDCTGLSESPYMLFVMPVREDKRAKIPAVTHVDGSARIQTVSKTDNPKYHALIAAFEKLTGVPVVLNTSFNVKGEPIVNTPADALRCFLGTGIDLLVLHDVVVEKKPEVVAQLAAKRARKADSGRVVDGRISAA
ncbi:MAG TPA: carbamoyltransferase C-terminal domain-containing protein [Myxococcales bacterium]|jgi:carbamoyltransferase